MGSTSNSTNSQHHHHVQASNDYDSNNTTFVQADPSNFRTIVQQLTGVSDKPSTQKLPLTYPARDVSKKPAFKLHERRRNAKNLEIQLNKSVSNINYEKTGQPHLGFHKQHQQRGFLVSPVSPLEVIVGRVISPRSPYPLEEEEEEQKGISKRGFYLHPSPLSTPRSTEPELLSLFPLHSPDHKDDDNGGNWEM